MESSNGSSTDHKLQFYCRDCGITFESFPDETGYEQAPCPKCNYVCMTVEFEREELERLGREADVVSLFGLSVGGLVGLFYAAWYRLGLRTAKPDALRRDDELRVIVSTRDREDGENLVGILKQNGIPAVLKEPGSDSVLFEVLTSREHRKRATQIVKATDEDAPSSNSQANFPSETPAAGRQFPMGCDLFAH